MHEEDLETPFQAMDAQQLAEKTAWLGLFVREASKRAIRLKISPLSSMSLK